jgi:hypothetical protein
MPDNTQVERIRQKYVAIAPHLDERGRRQWAAVEARAIGWGGVATVAAATGLSDRTVRTGIQELDDPDRIEPGRQRRSGAGRPPKEVVEPELVSALESIIESSTRGDPMSALRWTRNCGLGAFASATQKCRSYSKPAGTACRQTGKLSRERSILIETLNLNTYTVGYLRIVE